MKTKSKQKLVSSANSIALDRSVEQLLQCLLSPLELEASKHNYKKFNFQFKNIIVPITRRDCKQLLNTIITKIDFFSSILSKITNNMIKGSDFDFQFLLTPIDSLNISTYLKHRLLDLDCKNVLDVIRRGKARVSASRGFGAACMQELNALLQENGCHDLFI